jgi:DNA polymerase/3'-5' exonuclease PolX
MRSRLEHVAGVGEAVAMVVKEILDTGTSRLYEKWVGAKICLESDRIKKLICKKFMTHIHTYIVIHQKQFERTRIGYAKSEVWK